jgi:hypothetical protein
MVNWEEYEMKRPLNVARNASERLPRGSEESKKKKKYLILDSRPSDENSKLGTSDYDSSLRKTLIAITL